jgi:hypothetical protein
MVSDLEISSSNPSGRDLSNKLQPTPIPRLRPLRKQTSTCLHHPRIYLIADPSQFGGVFPLGAAALPSYCATDISCQ